MLASGGPGGQKHPFIDLGAGVAVTGHPYFNLQVTPADMLITKMPTCAELSDLSSGNGDGYYGPCHIRRLADGSILIVRSGRTTSGGFTMAQATLIRPDGSGIFAENTNQAWTARPGSPSAVTGQASSCRPWSAPSRRSAPACWPSSSAAWPPCQPRAKPGAPGARPGPAGLPSRAGPGRLPPSAFHLGQRARPAAGGSAGHAAERPGRPSRYLPPSRRAARPRPRPGRPSRCLPPPAGRSDRDRGLAGRLGVCRRLGRVGRRAQVPAPGLGPGAPLSASSARP